MKLIAQVKLLPTPEQEKLLRQTLESANAACDYISAQAWERKTFGAFALQKVVYRDTRDKFALSAQVVVRCIAKVADAYKLDRKTKRTFRPYGAISYDSRVLSYNLEKSLLSIWTLGGRQTMPFVTGARQRELLSGQRGESDLVLVAGVFYLLACCDVETPEPADVSSYLGVDMGIVNLAGDSDGETFSGAGVDMNRRKYAHRRRNLQRNGSKAARRKLKKIAGRQARFQKDVNHCISKRVVRKAQDTARGIGLENLAGIRARVTVRAKQRARHANWAFFQLRTFIGYKAARAGVPVVLVDPRNTSRECPQCAHIDKANRPSQSKFCCVRCGHAGPADTVAAVNIAARAAVIRPMVSTLSSQGQATPL